MKSLLQSNLGIRLLMDMQIHLMQETEMVNFMSISIIRFPVLIIHGLLIANYA